MAKAVGKLNLSLDEVSQEINLNEITGVDLSNDPSLVSTIGQEIIDYMTERTLNGKEIGGSKDLKKPYSKSYQDSIEFRAFGKSADEVNMTLTGDMLGSIDIADDKPDALKIAIEGDLETKKAYNHNVGDTLPKRPFFGITEDELDSILSKHDDDISALKNQTEETKQAIREGVMAQAILEDIFNNLNFDVEGL